MTPNEVYTLDLARLVRWLTPTFLRKARLLALLYSQATPLLYLYDAFVKGRANDLFRLGISSSVGRLEYMLNTVFYPPGLNTAYPRRIVIAAARRVDPHYLYLGGLGQPVNENKPLYTPTAAEFDALPPDNRLYLYRGNETTAYAPDFTVQVPTEAGEVNRAYMHSLLRSYALPDKTFLITTY